MRAGVESRAAAAAAASGVSIVGPNRSGHQDDDSQLRVASSPIRSGKLAVMIATTAAATLKLLIRACWMILGRG